MIEAQRFISQTGMTFATGPGTELTAVDNALGAYHKKPGPDTAGLLATAIVNWAKAKGLKANGDINTGRNAAVVKQLVTDVGNTKGGEACKNLKAVVGATAPAPGGGSAADLVAGVIGELNKCKNFACSDVGTFAGDINRSLSQQRQNEIYSKGIARAQATGYPVKNGSWDAGQLVQAYNAVYKKAAGECTSFALAAGHILSTLKPVRNMP